MLRDMLVDIMESSLYERRHACGRDMDVEHGKFVGIKWASYMVERRFTAQSGLPNVSALANDSKMITMRLPSRCGGNNWIRVRRS